MMTPTDREWQQLLRRLELERYAPVVHEFHVAIPEQHAQGPFDGVVFVDTSLVCARRRKDLLDDVANYEERQRRQRRSPRSAMS